MRKILVAAALTLALYACGGPVTDDQKVTATEGAYSTGPCTGATPAYHLDAYAGPNLTGGCVRLGPYSYVANYNQMLGISIGSLRIGAFVNPHFWTGTFFTGTETREEIATYARTRAGLPDGGSLNLQPFGKINYGSTNRYCDPVTWHANNPYSNEVIFFAGTNYTGACAIYTGVQGIPVLSNYGWGGYSLQFPYYFVASIKVGTAINAAFYSQAYYTTNGEPPSLMMPGMQNPDTSAWGSFKSVNFY